MKRSKRADGWLNGVAVESGPTWPLLRHFGVWAAARFRRLQYHAEQFVWPSSGAFSIVERAPTGACPGEGDL